ncbi:MAG: exopolysaccharide biosynthesis polyprenyl glycosylphosphotransferase [Bryobacteraceae bacterium]|nr:exopolysaccharide biosynthesis polyprenyl glycosylphosphotransferase [Bryobacteraceae bacterium]
MLSSSRVRAIRVRACYLSLDVVALVAAWYSTVELRLSLNHWFDRQLQRDELLQVAPSLTSVAAMWVVATLWLRNTNRDHLAARGRVVLLAAESALLAGALTALVSFFSRSFGADLSRSFVILFLPVLFIAMILGRYAALLACEALERRFSSSERIAVVGHGPDAERVIDQLRSRGSYQATVTGLILPQQADSLDQYAASIPVLGTTACLAEVINRTGLDRLVVTHAPLSARELHACATVSTRMGVIISRPLEFDGAHGRVGLCDDYGLPLLDLHPVEFTRGQELLKRSFDLLTSALLLLVLSPLLALIAAAVKLTSPGPAIYRSTRVGKGGRYFTFLKFRSMYTAGHAREALPNEKSGHLFKIRRDPRVTPLGRVLRRCSLDELPQLLNVLRGDMSMVGPRPLPASDLDPDGQSRQFEAWAEQRSRVLPGITGLWQIRGRSDLPFEKMVELDIEYIRAWSLMLDFRILLETPLVLVTGKGAY